jgi:LAGLIDADG DNA endonuclease family protein
LFYIKKELGFGIVRVQDKKNKTHCFKVNNKEGLLKIISIFNGNLYLESRKEQFKLWLIAVNKFYLVLRTQEISYIENLSKPSLDNS